MSDSAPLRAAVAVLADGETLASIAAPFADLWPGTSAAVSTLGDPFGVQTVAATDAAAVRCAEAQIDIGEGPIWLARSSRRPVLLCDVAGAWSSWPAFGAVVAECDVRSVFAFPMTAGALEVGVVSIYSVRERRRPPADLTNTLLLVQMVARRVLQHALDEADGNALPGSSDFFSRREVHQATGMAIAQLGVNAEDALLTIRAYAYATGATVRDVAHAMVSRELDLSRPRDED